MPVPERNPSAVYGDEPLSCRPEPESPGDHATILEGHAWGTVASVLHPLSLDLEWARSVLMGAPGEAADRAAASGHPEAAAMEACVAAVRFANAQARLLGRRLIHQRQVWFCFKVVYRSDETREELVSLMVDPLTEEVDPIPAPLGGRDMVLDGGAALDGYPLRRLYRQACCYVQEAAAVRGQEYARSAQRRLERDMVRLEDYYAGLREEALEPVARELHRLEAARNRARLWRALVAGQGEDLNAPAEADPEGGDEERAALKARVDRIVAALDADQARRVRELQEKYRVRAEASLLAAALVWAPKVELRYKLTGAARREVTFYYDPLRRRCVDLNCDACGAPLAVTYLCAAGDLACPDCYAPCAACGRPLCRACAPARCHVCDAPLCGLCPTECPLPSLTQVPNPDVAVPGPEPYRVCAACRARTCAACAALAGFLAG
ncbi:MAG TPA: hypothetical protein VIK93_05735 [Limnochordales bacterium]